MADIERTADQLKELLDEQLDFLKLSCSAFDDGFLSEIKRLAVSVRVLVHDTQNSISLLTLVNKKGADFLDSAIPYNDESVISHSSLVQFHKSQSGAKPKAHLDEPIQSKPISFDDWWNGIVLVDSVRNEFSRRDITLFLANKDGGAHVDHKIDEKFNNLRYNNSQGWINVRGDGKHIAGEDNVPATMRQIAHELIKTLDKSYTCKHPVSNETEFIVSGMAVSFGTNSLGGQYPNLRTDRPKIAGKKVGRNDSCPCGSGKKYKKCCI